MLLPRTHILESLSLHLSRISRENPELDVKLNVNLQLVALRRAWLDLMKVHSAVAALEICGLSSRCISDIKRAIDHVEQVPWHMHFVVREFLPIPFEFELRGFVFQRRLVALTQYATDIFVESFVSHKQIIENNVCSYFETQVKPRLDPVPDLEDYILDLVIMWPDLSSIKVLELNPYTNQTGAGFFDWTIDADLLHGKAPFLFRVRTEALPAGKLDPMYLVEDVLNNALVYDVKAKSSSCNVF